MKKHDLIKLPFDQYSRQYYVSQIINEIQELINIDNPKIIDLGGHKGKTKEFSKKSDVTILDVFDESYPNYIKGDALETPFSDENFSFSVSFDVLEHIPKSKRKRFIDEASRISTHGVFLAFPCDDNRKNTSKAEEEINSIHNKIYGVDHRWLKEHIDFGIPKEEEINSTINDLGLYFCSMKSNPIHLWSQIQTIITITQSSSSLASHLDEINTFYNSNLLDIDISDKESYRRIYYISKNKKNVEIAKKYMKNLTITNGKNDTSHTISRKINDILVEQMLDKTKLEKEKEMLLKQNNDLRLLYESVINSRSWTITKPLRELTSNIRRKKR